MLVVMPIGGQAKRFTAKGYTFPKPLIPIRNKPMLQWAVESLNMPWAHHIFVCHQDDVRTYPMRQICAQLTPQQTLVVEETRQGAATAVLRGLQDVFPPTENVLIANCDQWLQWDANEFYRRTPGVDGLIPVFPSAHPKWSYAQVNEAGQVVAVAEKQPISPWATCGLYYWKTVRAFREAAQQMMADPTKQVNGEWYVAPVYNELIARGGNVRLYTEVDMWSMGTPEDLEEFKLRVCRP